MITVSKLSTLLRLQFFLSILFLCPVIESADRNIDHLKIGTTWTYRYYKDMYSHGSSPIITRTNGKVELQVLFIQMVNDTFKFSIEKMDSTEIQYSSFFGTSGGLQSNDTISMAYFNDTLLRYYTVEGDGVAESMYRPIIRYGQNTWTDIPIPAISTNIDSQVVDSVGKQPGLKMLIDTYEDHSDTSYFIDGTGLIYATHHGSYRYQSVTEIYRLISYNSFDFNIAEVLPDIDSLPTAILAQPKTSGRIMRPSASNAPASYNLLGKEVTRTGVQSGAAQVIITGGVKRLFSGPWSR